MGRTNRHDVVPAREMLMRISLERYGLRMKDLADELRIDYGSPSLWARRGAKRRAGDHAFDGRLEAVVAAVASGR